MYCQGSRRAGNELNPNEKNEPYELKGGVLQMRWIKAIKRRILKLSKQIVGILPLKKKKVLFVSYWGKGYGDEGKAITEELLKAKTKLNIIWAVKREYKDTLPKGVRYVEYNTRKYMFHLMTAKVWLDNARKSSDIKKRPGQ